MRATIVVLSDPARATEVVQPVLGREGNESRVATHLAHQPRCTCERLRRRGAIQAGSSCARSIHVQPFAVRNAVGVSSAGPPSRRRYLMPRCRA